MTTDWSDYFNSTGRREEHYYRAWVWDFRRQFKRVLEDERWRFRARLEEAGAAGEGEAMEDNPCPRVELPLRGV